MHKLIFFTSTILSTFVYSQVAIGKMGITTLEDNVTQNMGISLEFGNQNKGMILPWVTSASAVTGAVNGTFIFDTSDKKVKVLQNNTWTDLSVDESGVVDTSLQDTRVESTNAKVVIGKNGENDRTPGILVLSDTDKAMILPKVASPHINMINPAAGMIVYDTVARQLAVFNGKVWSFWKP